MIAIWLFGLLAKVLFVSNLSLLFGATQGPQTQPNIVLINLDDADMALMSPETIGVRFPNMQQLVTDGLSFTNLHVTTPLCGPSRACLFRGQYAHNTGIRTNNSLNSASNGFQGDMALYKQLGHSNDDLAVWLKGVGYQTMLVGRYLNGAPDFEIPAGWDKFNFTLGGSYYESARYTNQTNPNGSFHKMEPGQYRTDVESLEAAELIQDHVAERPTEPFFLYLAPLAPHRAASNAVGSPFAERYEHWWNLAVQPRDASYNEVHIQDKSDVINWTAPLSDNAHEWANSLYRERLKLTRSIDDMFGLLMQTLEDSDVLDNTYVIVTSDNGFQIGHHRMFGKGTSFQRSTQVPCYVIGPGVPKATTANHLLAHIDITSTIADLAGAAVPDFVDGKSFLPLLSEPGAFDEQTWRSPILIENWESKNLQGQKVYTASTALRFHSAIYTEWADGTSGYYDLTKDPLQLRNVYNSLPVLDKEALKIQIRQEKDVMEPETVIAQPFVLNQLVDDQFVLTGLAEDDEGIDAVRLTIWNHQSKKYWNGLNWTNQRVRVDADVTNPGHQISTWRYSKMPRGSSVEQRVSIWARAYGVLDDFDRNPARTVVRLEPTTLDGGITSPEQNEVVDGLVLVEGDVSTSHTIDEVWLVVKQLDDQLFWDGKEWTEDWAYVNASIDEQGWFHDLELSDGRYFVSSRLWSGNTVQSPPAVRRFTVVND